MSIVSKPATPEYRNNFEDIFGGRKDHWENDQEYLERRLTEMINKPKGFESFEKLGKEMLEQNEIPRLDRS